MGILPLSSSNNPHRGLHGTSLSRDLWPMSFVKRVVIGARLVHTAIARRWSAWPNRSRATPCPSDGVAFMRLDTKLHYTDIARFLARGSRNAACHQGLWAARRNAV